MGVVEVQMRMTFAFSTCSSSQPVKRNVTFLCGRPIRNKVNYFRAKPIVKCRVFENLMKKEDLVLLFLQESQF
jgi:hypothetical protein